MLVNLNNTKRLVFFNFKHYNMTLFIIFHGFIGAPQVILILAAILLLFGGRKIPELMKGLGSGIKEFKKATKEDEKGSETVEEEKENPKIENKKDQ